jgi:pyrroline-5-carboxylate reductase
MPNTPCLIGKGMCVFDLDTSLTNDDMEIARSIFESVGKVEMLPSSLMEAVTGVSGSGPAYVYIFIEAMADAGVLNGLPRDIAYKLAAQTVLGSAAMVLESGEHPAKLKDAVCSPGGTTIEAVYALEREGFRGAVIAAINDCTVKAKKLS